MNTKTKNMVGVALFTAIVVVLQFLGGGIRVGGMFSISLVLIPIVVGSAIYGWQAGAWLGFAFGVAVLMSGDANSFLAVDFPATVLVVLVKGTCCGLFTGLAYKLLSHLGKSYAVYAAAVLCPVVNTGIFLLGCQLFFFETISTWGASLGFENAYAYMFLGLAGINFIVEIVVNIVLAPMIIRLIKFGSK